MKPRRPTIFRFVLQAHAVAVSGMSNAEVGSWFRNLLRDLESGKPTTDVAREMIEDRNRIIELTHQAGLASARARAGISDDPNNVSGAAPPKPAVKPGDAPTLEHWLAHAAVIGMPDDKAREAYEFWTNAGWIDTKGRNAATCWKIKLGQAKARAIESRTANRRPGGPAAPEKSTFDDDDPLFGSEALSAHQAKT